MDNAAYKIHIFYKSFYIYTYQVKSCDVQYTTCQRVGSTFSGTWLSGTWHKGTGMLLRPCRAGEEGTVEENIVLVSDVFVTFTGFKVVVVVVVVRIFEALSCKHCR